MEIGLHLPRRFFAIAKTFLLYKWRAGLLGSYVEIHSKRFLGAKNAFFHSRVHIMYGCRIETISHFGGKKYSPKLILKEGVVIGQNSHITCAESIVIGRNTILTGNVTITDQIHEHLLVDKPAYEPTMTKKVEIGDNCTIFNNAVILPGTKLGDFCVVGANSVIKGHFSQGSKLHGVKIKHDI